MKKWCILINMLVCGIVPLQANDVVKTEASMRGAEVNISVEDALKSNDLATLKKSLFETQQAMVLLELDNKTLKEEKDIIYREFIEIHNKFQKQNENYHRLQLILADVVTSSDVRKSDKEKYELLKLMDDYSKYGGELALQSIQFCEFVSELIKSTPIGKVRQAELNLQRDALETRANKFITLSSFYEDDKDNMGRCRILAVDNKLNSVILSVGTVHGAFNGLIYRSGKEPLLLKVVAVRPYIAAAVVISGNVKDLSPGMEAVSEQKKQ